MKERNEEFKPKLLKDFELFTESFTNYIDYKDRDNNNIIKTKINWEENLGELEKDITCSEKDQNIESKLEEYNLNIIYQTPENIKTYIEYMENKFPKILKKTPSEAVPLFKIFKNSLLLWDKFNNHESFQYDINKYNLDFVYEANTEKYVTTLENIKNDILNIIDIDPFKAQEYFNNVFNKIYWRKDKRKEFVRYKEDRCEKNEFSSQKTIRLNHILITDIKKEIEIFNNNYLNKELEEYLTDYTNTISKIPTELFQKYFKYMGYKINSLIKTNKDEAKIYLELFVLALQKREIYNTAENFKKEGGDF